MYATHHRFAPAQPPPRRRWDDGQPLWTIATRSGHILARRITLAQLEARMAHGLLPGAAFVASQHDPSWRPIAQILAPSGARRLPCSWYVTRPGKIVVGPVDTDCVQRGILAGKIPTDALICRAGEQRWQLLDDVPEFAEHVVDTVFDAELTRMFDQPPPPVHSRGMRW